MVLINLSVHDSTKWKILDTNKQRNLLSKKKHSCTPEVCQRPQCYWKSVFWTDETKVCLGRTCNTAYQHELAITEEKISFQFFF